jgi:hypothetical protein
MNKNKQQLSGYPENPSSEDVYRKLKEETAIDPNDITKEKTPNEDPHTMNEKDFLDDMSGDDLDIPGSELDAQQEEIGCEDEEKDYYSLGGDTRSNLDEEEPSGFKKLCLFYLENDDCTI